MRLSLSAAVVAVGMCLIAGVAKAELRQVSWSNPTTYVDGSPLLAADITRTTVVWGASATAMTSSKVVTGSATSTTIDLAPGTWFVGARTTAKGVDSAISNVVQSVVVQPAPNPPVISVVPVVAGLNMSPAYKILASGERSQVVAGFVPVGTGCDGPVAFKYRNREYRIIPASKVKWWNPPLADVRNPPPVAVACG